MSAPAPLRFAFPAVLLALLASVAGGQGFGLQEVISTTTNGASCVFAADLDGDGDADALSASSADDMVAWYENLGDGDFGARQVITTVADHVNSVFAVDLDGDGDLDVLAAGSQLAGDQEWVGWHENLGGNAFGPAQSLSYDGLGIAPNIRVSACDLDGDGDADVLTVADGWGGVRWCENEGNGSFPNWELLWGQPFSPMGVIAADAVDYDGDGDTDLLACNELFLNHRRIILVENIGSGSFQTTFEFVVSTTNFALAPIRMEAVAADLNGDGLVDLAYSSRDTTHIGWHQNLGGNQFADQVNLGSVSQPWSLEVVDLDQDGDSDVLSAGHASGRVFWLENDGSGVFGPRQMITTEALGVASVMAGDMDGDGDLEVVSASRFPEKIAWHENLMGAGDVSSYCSASANSSGGSAWIARQGTNSLAAADLELTVQGAPPGAHGVFFYAAAQGFSPFGDGTLCVTPPTFRLCHIPALSSSGTANLPLDFNTPPLGSGPGRVLPGSNWNFQFAFRDPMGGAAGFNLSDGLSVTFCP